MKKLLLIVCVLLLASQAGAADRHVGSGQTYSTVAAGIAASGTGDRVVIHQGTYNEYDLFPKSNTTIIGAKQTGSYPSESMPIVNGGRTAYGSVDTSVFVLYPYTSNLTIDGIEVRNGGRANIYLTDAGSNNVTIQNCVSRIDAWTTYATDNAANIYIDTGTTNLIIRNNYLYSSVSGVHGVNGYRGDGRVTIENNNIYITSNQGTKNSHGIFWKHGGSGDYRMSIKNNALWISGSANGGIWVVNDNTDIENNLIIATGTSPIEHLWIGGSMGVTGGSGSAATHNTVYATQANGRTGLMQEDGYYPANTVWQNNVFRTSANGEYYLYSMWFYGSGSYTVTSDYNLFYNAGSTTAFQRYTSSYNLTAWKALGYDAHSYFENPGFANGSGTFNLISDFEITSGAGNNAASDSTDMGADISLVGANSGEGDVTAPGISAVSPSGILSYGTTTTDMYVTTNEAATCKYSTTDVAYTSMPYTFSTTGGTSHSQTLTGLTNGSNYLYYVRCMDLLSNVNTSSLDMSWAVSSLGVSVSTLRGVILTGGISK